LLLLGLKELRYDFIEQPFLLKLIINAFKLTTHRSR